jgi:hypothetical protein
MSSSISAAKKRRANISQTQQQSPMQPQQQQQQQIGAKPMSLPQVLKMFDSRLATLENATKEAKPESSIVESQIISQEETNAIKEILNEYDERFQMLAGEIQEMKSALMKLQTYTMDVNKTLLEERVQYMTPVVNSTIPSSTIDQPIDYDNIVGTSETIEMRDANVDSTPENLSSEENDNQQDETTVTTEPTVTNEINVDESNEDFEVSFSTNDKKMKKKGRK